MAALPTVAGAAVDPDGTLTADGNSAGTYDLINARGYQAETPDMSRDHASAPFQHIRQTWDADLGAYCFQFLIHALIDDDRGLADVTDRQRNEIKTSAKSPAFMVGQEGDSVVMRWKFKLPLGMVTTKKFCHVHQLKGIDNKAGTADVAHPLLTFTCCTVGSGSSQELQVRWQDRLNENATVYLARTDLKPLLGCWLEAEERVRYGRNGSYALTVRDLTTGKVIIDVPCKALDMWRTDCDGLRPKWGIYRYIGDNRSLEGSLRDEEVRFADFSIRPVVPADIKSVTAAPSSGRCFDLSGRPVSGSFCRGIMIRRGRKIMKL